MENKFIEAEDLALILEKLKQDGKKIGLSHGVFDLLHPGHIQHFIAAKRDVDILIVSITADKFVNKGPGRPIFNEQIRISTLSALSAVDFVTISRDKTAEKLIEILTPDIYFKGSDYANDSDDPTGKIKDEKHIVEKFGGKIHFTNEMTSSSSKLINSFLNVTPIEVQNWLKEIKNEFSVSEIEEYLNKLSQLKIAVVGEIIIDAYTKVEALAKSSKDPILAFRLLESEIYAGGILAIANNCSAWVSSVTAVSIIGHNDDRPTNLAKILNNNINLMLTKTERPTITKHRFIDVGTNAKLFETYDFDPSPIPENELESVKKNLNNVIESDLVLVADYGHGLMDPLLIEYLTSKKIYLSVNTQSNAGNRGYNTITKYPRVDFFTANSGELKLELRSQNVDYDSVMPKLINKLKASSAILTKGADGLTIYGDGDIKSAPAIATKIVDKVGAGDSVFAIASLLAYIKTPPAMIGFIASIVASHEVAQFGHKNSLTLGDLKKQIRTMLS